jgi:hypothetical protein
MLCKKTTWVELVLTFEKLLSPEEIEDAHLNLSEYIKKGDLSEDVMIAFDEVTMFGHEMTDSQKEHGEKAYATTVQIDGKSLAEVLKIKKWMF